MQLLFGPIPGAGESILALVFSVLIGVLYLGLLFSFLRSFSRIPAAFAEGYRNVAGDDGDDISFWRYVVPIVGAELLVVAALSPSLVDSLFQVVALTVYLFIGTLLLAGLVAGSYLVVRRFEDGFRIGSGESGSNPNSDSTPRRYVWWLVGLAASLTAAAMYGFETYFGFHSQAFAVVSGFVFFCIAIVSVALVSAIGVLAVRRFRDGYRTNSG